MSTHDFLSRRQVAEEFSPILKLSTLEKWAQPAVGGGPPFFKLSERRVVYRRADVIAWINAHAAVDGDGLPPTRPVTRRGRRTKAEIIERQRQEQFRISRS